MSDMCEDNPDFMNVALFQGTGRPRNIHKSEKRLRYDFKKLVIINTQWHYSNKIPLYFGRYRLRKIVTIDYSLYSKT